MAVLERYMNGDETVEVRCAGHTRRLYVDGILHSQFNPAQPLTGGYWDAMALSALMAPAEIIQRVLLLGLGGGAIIHLLQRYARPESIVAIEHDKRRINIARKHFEVRGAEVELIHGDAREWIENYRGEPFDLVIDDLFAQTPDDAMRSIPLGRSWSKALTSVLRSPGWLAVNCVNTRELRASSLMQVQRYKKEFPSAFRFIFTDSGNAVGVFCGEATTTGKFRQVLRKTPKLASWKARPLMRFKISTLW